MQCPSSIEAIIVELRMNFLVSGPRIHGIRTRTVEVAKTSDRTFGDCDGRFPPFSPFDRQRSSGLPSSLAYSAEPRLELALLLQACVRYSCQPQDDNRGPSDDVSRCDPPQLNASR